MADVKSAGENDARKNNAGQFVLNILNGTTIAIVVALIRCLSIMKESSKKNLTA